VLAVFLLSLPLATVLSGGSARLTRTALATLATLAGLAAVRRDYLRQGPRAACSLCWDGEGAFTLELRSGEIAPVRLGHGSLVAGPWLWLVLQGRRRHPVFIDRGSLEPAAAAALLRLLRQKGRRPADLR
jgi:hypothetical protein